MWIYLVSFLARKMFLFWLIFNFSAPIYLFCIFNFSAPIYLFWSKINLIGSIVLRMVRFLFSSVFLHFFYRFFYTFFIGFFTLFSSVRSHWIKNSILSINYCQITGIITGYKYFWIKQKKLYNFICYQIHFIYNLHYYLHYERRR